MFYRTSSPSGPLPCYRSLTNTNIQSRATGIADHILPLGDWFFFFSVCPPPFRGSNKNSIGHRPLRGRCPSNHLTPTYTHIGATGTADHLTLLRLFTFSAFLSFLSPDALVTFSSTAPAHPHATLVAVYLALLDASSPLYNRGCVCRSVGWSVG